MTTLRLRSVIPLLAATLLVAAALVRWPDERAPVRTTFAQARALFAPTPRAGFNFAILGDRTHGPESGLAILEQGVREINSLDPDFVMTVGDLINGYNRPDEWLAQMRAYHGVMNGLRMPWFPVAGNHDVYPPSNLPGDRGNEGRYLEHFGPLWYSFDHEFAHFVVLYSDEQLSFRNPAVDQRMSEQQLRWLEEDLAATDRKQTFLFLHHPRWNYAGDPWAPVHEVLVKSGKVRAVFAGHWHRYRSDGERDGVRYYVMSATGAAVGKLDQAGDFQHVNIVSVRADGFTMGVLPIGSVKDQDFVTGAESDDCIALLRGDWLTLAGELAFAPDAPTAGMATLRLRNPARRPFEVRLDWSSGRDGVTVEPATHALTLAAAEEAAATFVFAAAPLATDGVPRRAPTLEAVATYRLHGGEAQEFRTIVDLPVRHPAPPAGWDADVAAPAADRALVLDGQSACVVVPAAAELHPAGPFTLECWAKLETVRGRTGLLNLTEQSGYGFFLERDGRLVPSWHVFVDGAGYATALAGEGGSTPERWTDQWIHIAGTWDGSDATLYLGGRAVATARNPGKLLGNKLPLLIGADVDGGGRATSFMQGRIDEVRLSRIRRYTGDFEPARRFAADAETVLLLHLDQLVGNRTPDSSGHGHHGEVMGAAYLAPARD